ncbi:YpdA family putative bacillithiol disulfide reductase [Heliobacterium chlorum]|uniref:YpdA family putative bacillithiol disulfide reductase n=2 Tax=Heliobacterium chlorum TaxID=2698 RepID=A0ABR7T3P5_HELCL|nr:YpdA family putative bacillithiol disulfide reductase [Heliobacterium chlorum]
MHDMIIVGSGPCGLACAIEAKIHGLDFVVLEKGSIVDSVVGYPTYMILSSTTDMLEVGGLPFVVQGCRPTRQEAVRYYLRAAQHFDVPIKTYRQVTDIQRTDTGFMVHAKNVFTGEIRIYFSKRVIVATGCYNTPNLLGIPGENLPHVSHYYKEAFPYSGRKTVVVGGGNSAAETALDLYRHGSDVTLVHRCEQLDGNVKPWIGADILSRILKEDIPTFFNSHLESIQPRSVTIRRDGDRYEVEADFVFLMTGYRPNAKLLVDAGVALDEYGFPTHNPLTMETNIPGLYVAGAISEGWRVTQANIEKGRFHGKRIIQSFDEV